MAYKASKQRDMVYHYMQKQHLHLSAEEIYKGINQNGQSISLATVYRNLGILEDMGLIHKIALPHGVIYEADLSKHDHFYCEECHTLYDLEDTYDASSEGKIMHNDVVGSLVGHELTYLGVCKHCMEQKQQ